MVEDTSSLITLTSQGRVSSEQQAQKGRLIDEQTGVGVSLLQVEVQGTYSSKCSSR